MAVADGLARFRAEVQAAESLRAKANAAGSLDASEAHMLYEATFLRIFRAYENFLEETFLSYLVGEATVRGTVLKPYVTPLDLAHARKIVTSSQPFLDWTNPQTVISRAETYIEDGGPIKMAIASSQSSLKFAKRIRNHIAHNSAESESEYRGVVVHFLLTPPTPLPSAGEFLAKKPTSGHSKNKEIFTFFTEALANTVTAVAEA